MLTITHGCRESVRVLPRVCHRTRAPPCPFPLSSLRPPDRATFESRAAQKARPPPTAVHTAPFTPRIHYRAAFSAPVSLRKKKTETGFLPEWSPDKAGGRRGPPGLCVPLWRRLDRRSCWCRYLARLCPVPVLSRPSAPLRCHTTPTVVRAVFPASTRSEGMCRPAPRSQPEQLTLSPVRSRSLAPSDLRWSVAEL